MFQDLYFFFSGQLLLFLLVLCRISGVVMLAPIFGTAEIPAQVRALLAGIITVLIFSAQSFQTVPEVENLTRFVLLVGGELLVGLVLGLGVSIWFTGIQIAGGVLSQVSGMSIGDVFNPGLDSSVPLFSQFLYMFSLAIFAVIGGHRLVLSGILDTFSLLPPGQVTVSSSIFESIIALVGQSFQLGFRVAAPSTIALLLATIVLGLISRTIPQLNVLALGFGLNSLVTFATLAVCLGAMGWLMQEDLAPTLEVIWQGFHGELQNYSLE